MFVNPTIFPIKSPHTHLFLMSIVSAVIIPLHNKVVEGIYGLFVRMFTFCHHSSDLIYYPISILLHISIGYDNTSNNFAFQRDRVKVKITVII